MLEHFSIYQQKSPICKSKNTWPRRNKQFKSEIRNTDMTSKLNLNLRANPNENYNVLTTTLSKAMEKKMPTKLVKFNKKDIKNLNGLRKISLIQLLTEIKCEKKLRTYKKILNSSIYEAKSSYYHRCFENAKNDMKNNGPQFMKYYTKKPPKQNFLSTFSSIDGKQI